jgi:hypothetical protein
VKQRRKPANRGSGAELGAGDGEVFSCRINLGFWMTVKVPCQSENLAGSDESRKRLLWHPGFLRLVYVK